MSKLTMLYKKLGQKMPTSRKKKTYADCLAYSLMTRKCAVHREEEAHCRPILPDERIGYEMCKAGKLLRACHIQRDRAREAENEYQRLEQKVLTMILKGVHAGVSTIIDSVAMGLSCNIKRMATDLAVYYRGILRDQRGAADVATALHRCAEKFEAMLKSVAAEFLKEVPHDTGTTD